MIGSFLTIALLACLYSFTTQINQTSLMTQITLPILVPVLAPLTLLEEI